jgi:CBS domain-containing protein
MATMIEKIIEARSAAPDRRRSVRTVFSAFQLGKICDARQSLSRLTAGELEDVNEDTSASTLHELYLKFPDLDFLPVMRGGRLTGYVRRQMFFAQLSQTKFSRELLLRGDVTVSSIMDPRVLALDAEMTLSEASAALMAREESVRFDPFVILHEGSVLGTATVQRVIEGLNRYLHLDFQACDLSQKRIMEPMNRFVENPVRHSILVEPLIAPGGDYADFIELNERYSLGVLFDVCGKGLKASTMVTTIASVLRTLVYRLDFESIDLPNILLSLQFLNQLVYHLTGQEMYATGAVLILDKERMILSVMDFGHGFVWLKRGKSVHRLSAHMKDNGAVPFLGIHEDVAPPTGHFKVRPRDLVFVCSDGIVEARNAQKAEFTADGVRKALRNADCDPDHVVLSVMRSFNEHTGAARRTDDLSILSVLIETY